MPERNDLSLRHAYEFQRQKNNIVVATCRCLLYCKAEPIIKQHRYLSKAFCVCCAKLPSLREFGVWCRFICIITVFVPSFLCLEIIFTLKKFRDSRHLPTKQCSCNNYFVFFVSCKFVELLKGRRGIFLELFTYQIIDTL